MDYAVSHEGRAYTASGLVPLTSDDVAAHNAAQAAIEREWIATLPERLFLYVRETPLGPNITQWTGDFVAYGTLGPKRRMGFGGSIRQAVRCVIHGQPYHGWYYTSSGDYCRLTRSKASR